MRHAQDLECLLTALPVVVEALRANPMVSDIAEAGVGFLWRLSQQGSLSGAALPKLRGVHGLGSLVRRLVEAHPGCAGTKLLALL